MALRLTPGDFVFESMNRKKNTSPYNATSKDLVDTSSFSENSLRRMSGNGMHLGCGGFCLLMALLFVKDKERV